MSWICSLRGKTLFGQRLKWMRIFHFWLIPPTWQNFGSSNEPYQSISQNRWWISSSKMLLINRTAPLSIVDDHRGAFIGMKCNHMQFGLHQKHITIKFHFARSPLAPHWTRSIFCISIKPNSIQCRNLLLKFFRIECMHIFVYEICM